MKTLVIFYSYTGHTKAIAQKLAATLNAGAAADPSGGGPADIAEIRDARRPGMLKSFFVGCPAAIMRKSWPIIPLSADPAAYDKLILLAPIWANNVPPAVNAFLEKLPEGKAVAVKLISASGKSGCGARLESLIAAKKCKLDGIEDIKG
jgi:flavodoxin